MPMEASELPDLLRKPIVRKEWLFRLTSLMTSQLIQKKYEVLCYMMEKPQSRRHLSGCKSMLKRHIGLADLGANNMALSKDGTVLYEIDS